MLVVHSSYFWFNSWLLVGMSGQIYNQTDCHLGPLFPCPWYQGPPRPLFPLDSDRLDSLQRAFQEGREPLTFKDFAATWQRGTDKAPQPGATLP